MRNISNREFMLRYYLWGRPVIIEDAMDDWNLVGHWTEEYLTENINALKKRRRQSGESQLLNVLDKDDQAFLRKDYDIPYFLTLATEARRRSTPSSCFSAKRVPRDSISTSIRAATSTGYPTFRARKSGKCGLSRTRRLLPERATAAGCAPRSSTFQSSRVS